MNHKIYCCLLLLFSFSCKKKDVPQVNFANEMRSFVIEISNYSKAIDPDFLVIPQNGAPLITLSRNKDNVYAMDYLEAIDGQGQENLYYGYQKDDNETPSSETSEITYFLNICTNNNVPVLVTDYCSSQENINTSYEKNEVAGFTSFAANERALNVIPDYSVVLNNENDSDIVSLSDAQNFLYLINPNENYADKGTFINAVNATNYDLIIMDYAFDGELFTTAEINSLKLKENGGHRLVVSYMSIGEAEDYRNYWQSEWKKRNESPEWLYEENKKWRGNYKVFYWMETWKSIIYGNEDAYLDRLLQQGFDGAYLDIIDAYEFYENR